jgi:hypothetical protein
MINLSQFGDVIYPMTPEISKDLIASTQVALVGITDFFGEQ